MVTGWGADLARCGWRLRLLAYGMAGGVAALGQAPWGIIPATPLGLAVLMVALRADTGWRRAGFGAWAFGLGYFGVALHWIVQPFLVDVARHGWMAPFALVFMAAGLALFWGAAGAVAALIGRGRAGLLALVATLALAEAARSYVLSGFPWALIGHGWIGTPYAQLAAWAGPLGLTLWTLGLAALLVSLWPRLWLALPAAVMALIWVMLDPGPLPAPAPDASAPDAPLVRIVQPNAQQHLKWEPGMAEEFLLRQIRLTAQGGTDADPAHPPALIVWPETAVQWLLEYSDEILREVALAADGAPVVLGIQRREDARYYNSLVVLGADGRVAAQYDKWHLVPFGEYIPLGEVFGRFGIQGLAASAGGGYSSGPGPALVEVPGLGAAMPLICYEGIFAHEVNAAPGRARLLILITNDAWFGKWAGPEQHFAQARLRAIEQGLPLVRVANTGISGVIDGQGRVLGRIGLDVEGARDLPLPAPLPPTLYVRAGDWSALLVMLLLAAVAFALGRRGPGQNGVDRIVGPE